MSRAYGVSGSAAQRPSGLARARKAGRAILLAGLLSLLCLFTWHLVRFGSAGGERLREGGVAGKAFLLVCITLAANLPLELGSAIEEALNVRELPPEGIQGASSVRFRKHGPASVSIRETKERLEERFPRFYAFHRYEPPFVVHFYFAKRGIPRLFALPLAELGFLALFVFAGLNLLSAPAQASELLPAAAALSGSVALLLRLLVPYEKLWVRMVEEDGSLDLTLTCHPPRRPLLEEMSRALGGSSPPGAAGAVPQARA